MVNSEWVIHLEAAPGNSVCPDTFWDGEPGRDREVLVGTT